ncbi:hypothetical protein, partial [Vandammella animalimorsus]|uniref:hypothetical protein n=1 Tax=Vandammella animalimorsus TaxID=2029117 RepID=UPI001EED9ECD
FAATFISNAHAYRLYIFNEPYLPSNDLDSHRFAISEALYYNTKFQALKKFLNFLKSCFEDSFTSSEALYYNTKNFKSTKF